MTAAGLPMPTSGITNLAQFNPKPSAENQLVELFRLINEEKPDEDKIIARIEEIEKNPPANFGINGFDPKRMQTLLHRAVERELEKVVERLVKFKGINGNTLNMGDCSAASWLKDERETALMCAVNKSSLPMVKALLTIHDINVHAGEYSIKGNELVIGLSPLSKIWLHPAKDIKKNKKEITLALLDAFAGIGGKYHISDPENTNADLTEDEMQSKIIIGMHIERYDNNGRKFFKAEFDGAISTFADLQKLLAKPQGLNQPLLQEEKSSNLTLEKLKKLQNSCNYALEEIVQEMIRYRDSETQDHYKKIKKELSPTADLLKQLLTKGWVSIKPPEKNSSPDCKIM